MMSLGVAVMASQVEPTVMEREDGNDELGSNIERWWDGISRGWSYKQRLQE